MSRKELKFGNVLLCDHVARGENNKFVIVNAYSGGIIVQQYPVTIPLGLYIEHLPDKIGNVNIKLEVNVGEVKMAEVGIALNATELGPQVIAVGHFLVRVEEDTKIFVLASANGYKDTTVLEKEVRLGPIPSLHATASPLPPARSRRAARAS